MSSASSSAGRVRGGWRLISIELHCAQPPEAMLLRVLLGKSEHVVGLLGLIRVSLGAPPQNDMGATLADLRVANKPVRQARRRYRYASA